MDFNFLNVTHQGLAVVRFCQEPAFARNRLRADTMAGGEDNSDARPALANMMREAQAIKRAWHFDIREDDAHLWGCFEYPQGFAGIARLQNLETSLGEKVRTHQTNKRLVLDDEDDTARVCWFCLHRLVTIGFELSSFGLSG